MGFAMLLIKNILFTLIVPGTVGVYLPLMFARGRHPAGGAALAGTLVLFAIGGAIYTWCVYDFATFGRGTPAPIDAPTRLVRRGLYCYTRNPMYVGVLTVILGWALLYRSSAVAIYALVVATCFHSFVVFFEERVLGVRFGAEYQRYCAEVPRWLPWR